MQSLKKLTDEQTKMAAEAVVCLVQDRLYDAISRGSTLHAAEVGRCEAEREWDKDHPDNGVGCPDGWVSANPFQDRNNYKSDQADRAMEDVKEWRVVSTFVMTRLCSMLKNTELETLRQKDKTND